MTQYSVPIIFVVIIFVAIAIMKKDKIREILKKKIQTIIKQIPKHL